MKIDLSETADGICIHTQDGTVLLSNEQAYACLEWLWERRDALYQQQQHGEPAPARADGHISYHEAVQVKHLCPYCGSPGSLDSTAPDDPDFAGYICVRQHRFYVERQPNEQRN